VKADQDGSGVLGCGLRHHRRAIQDVSEEVFYHDVEGWCYQHVQDITIVIDQHAEKALRNREYVFTDQ
jgi:hypothetical protein